MSEYDLVIKGGQVVIPYVGVQKVDIRRSTFCWKARCITWGSPMIWNSSRTRQFFEK